MDLSSSQVLILQALDRNKGAPMSTKQLREKVGARVSVGADTLGPVNMETLDNGAYNSSLLGLKLVHTNETIDEDENGRKLVMWSLTKAGVAAAKKFKARKNQGGEHRVPPERLDPIARKALAVRTYQFEAFTEDDLREIRVALPKVFEGLDLEELKTQCVNRRKQGAFSDPNKKIAAQCKAAIVAFGIDGTAIKNLLTPEQVEKLEAKIEATQR